MTTTKKFVSDKPTIAEIRRLKKPAERSVELCIEPTLVRQYAKIRDEMDRWMKKQQASARRGIDLSDTTSRQIDELQLRLDALEEEIMEVTITFLARDPGRKVYENLVTQHSPTDQQKKDWKESGDLRTQGALQWNAETFVPALISLVYVEPAMTIEEADAICDEWGLGEISKLFNTALLVCNEVTTIPKFKSGTDEMSSTALNSITALNGESPTLDS
jgi:hypothetical protein